MAAGAFVYQLSRNKNPDWKKQLSLFEKGAEIASADVDFLDSGRMMDKMMNLEMDYDWVYLFDLDLLLADGLSALGSFVFNDLIHIQLQKDLASLYFRLEAHHIPTPLFLISPDTGKMKQEEMRSFFLKHLRKRGFAKPIYARPRYGLPGQKGTWIASELEFSHYLSLQGSEPFVLEEYTSGPYLLAYVVGNSVLGFAEMKEGGLLSRYRSSPDLVGAALAAKEACDLPAATVYMRLSKGDVPYVYGVSAQIRPYAYQQLFGKNIAEDLFAVLKKEWSKNLPLAHFDEAEYFAKHAK